MELHYIYHILALEQLFHKMLKRRNQHKVDFRVTHGLKCYLGEPVTFRTGGSGIRICWLLTGDDPAQSRVLTSSHTSLLAIGRRRGRDGRAIQGAKLPMVFAQQLFVQFEAAPRQAGWSKAVPHPQSSVSLSSLSCVAAMTAASCQLELWGYVCCQ